MSYQPVVIIGAPRSGTNMLRDVLTRFPGIHTWPCDEINYIWRHGNLAHEGDEFSADQATPGVIAYIRGRFDKIAKRSAAHTIVEKTCANSLRVGFVDRVLPDAKFIFIVRDGLDVVASAARRWRAPLDIPYLARKARFVPLGDIPYYASRYALNRLHKLFSSDKQLAVWGPMPAGSSSWSDEYDLLEICALQWQSCVRKSEEAFQAMPDAKVCRVRYEDFVQKPIAVMKTLLDFIDVDGTEDLITRSVSTVSDSSVGLGRTRLDNEQSARLRALIGTTLSDFGYRA